MIGLDTRRQFGVSFTSRRENPIFAAEEAGRDIEPIWTMWRKYRVHCRESNLGGPARSQIVY
jgi:predicted metal-dependent hydrolase